MSWGQALIEFRRTNKARSWSNFRAWDLKTDSKSACATSLVGSRSPPLTTSFGISVFDMSRGTHPPTLPMSSRMHHFPNRRLSDHRIAHTYQRGYGVDAAVVYHGGDTEKYLGEVDQLGAPLLMHLAEEDQFISKSAGAEIKAALTNKPNVTTSATRVRTMPSLGKVARTTMAPQQNSPMRAHTNF